MRVLAAVVVVLCAALPAVADARRGLPPRVLSMEIAPTAVPGVATSLRFTARDRDSAIRGYEIDYGDGSAIGISACVPRHRRRGRLERYEQRYTYLLPGVYTVKVRVLSGGCDEPQQRSRAVTRKVTVALPV